MKLRHILILLFCLIALAPVGVFWLWPYSKAMDSEINDVRERHLVIANGLARAMERYYIDTKTTVDVIASQIDDPKLANNFEPLFKGFSIIHICVVDLNTGNVMRSIQPDKRRCPVNVPSERFKSFKAMSKFHETTFTGVLKTPYKKNAVFALHKKEDVMIIVAIATDYLVTLGQSIVFGKRGHAAIVDQYGRVISHPRPDWQENRHDMSKVEIIQKMLSGKSGVEKFYSPALKEDMIAGYTHVKGAGWGVMVPQPISELYTKANSLEGNALTVMLIGLLAAVLMAIFAARLITSPIEKIAYVLERIGNGDLNVATDSKFTGLWTTELKTVGHNIFSMSNRLKESMEFISQQANKDELTGLCNRRVFFEKLNTKFLQAEKNQCQLIVGVLDLDGFKAINDNYGHLAGDKLLSEVAERLAACFNMQENKGICFRLGGDEFAILLQNDIDKSSLKAFGELVCRLLSEPYLQDNEIVHVSCSLGFSMFMGDEDTSKTLYERADYALYDAKNQGRNQVVIFSNAHLEEMNRKRAIEQELYKDGFIDELRLTYQPIINMKTGKITKFEALARWNNAELGEVPASIFIMLAEQLGLIRKMTMSLLEKTIVEALNWPNDINLSFNLSAKDLSIPDARHGIKNLILRSGIDPSRIEFEITETALIADVPQCQKIINDLRGIGVKFALDDFGTGYSSLSQVHNLPLHALKIDQSFMADLENDTTNVKIIKSILLMCKDMQLQCVAEGVESQVQVQKLMNLGCEYMQGYYFAKPMELGEIQSYITAIYQNDELENSTVEALRA